MTDSPIDAYLSRLHQDWLADGSGAVADYIPPLALADSDSFGIAITTTEGHSYEVGDSRSRFTIQSISKPFTYGLALHDCGFEAVDAKVGVEPSGEAFNSISLAPGSGRPLNPMINAGAITSTSLVAGDSATERERRVVDFYGRFAGRELEVDSEVYESERDTGHRNRAIGHMLRAFGVLEEDPDEALDLYFRQCSVSVDCRDLSLMAATLAVLIPLRFEEGERIFTVGDPADAGFLLLEGEVTLEVEIDGSRRRLATLTPGFSFGEFAFADASARPVSVRAESDGECLALTIAAFEEIGVREPALQAAILRNLLVGSYEIIGRTTREVGSLLSGR